MKLNEEKVKMKVVENLKPNVLKDAVEKYCKTSLTQNFEDTGILQGNLFVLESLEEIVNEPEFNERWVVLSKDGIIRLYDDEEEYKKNPGDPVL